MKKRILALLLIVCLVLSACGGSAGNTETTTKAEATTKEVVTVPETTTAAPETTTAAPETTTAAPETTTVAEDDPALTSVMGVIDGRTYSSELFKVKAAIPEQFYIATDAELGQIKEGLQDKIDTGSTIYDLYAVDQNTSDSIVITLFTVSLAEHLSLTATPGAYYDILIPELDKQYNALAETSNLEDVKVVKGTTTFLGKEVPCVILSWLEKNYNAVHYQTQIIVSALNNAKTYGLCITTGSYVSADQASELLKLFEAME